MMSGSPRSLKISVGLYRLLINAYPASFRRAYGTEMTQVFHDLADDAWRQHGAAGLMKVWLRLVPDVASSVAVEHSHETHRRLVMLWRFLGPAQSVVALGVALLVAALLTPADPLSQLALGLPLYGVYLCVLVSRPLPRGARCLAVLISVLPSAFLLGWMHIPRQRESMGSGSDGRLTPVVMVMALLVVPMLATALTVGLTLIAARTWRRTHGSNDLNGTPQGADVSN